MHRIDLSADHLVSALLEISKDETVCILDSCGVGHLGSHLLIAGINPTEVTAITNDDPRKVLEILDEKLSGENAAIFTVSYDFGPKLEKIASRHERSEEPDVFLALFDSLIVHDYDSGMTFITGDEEQFNEIERKLLQPATLPASSAVRGPAVTSNFTRAEYVSAVESIKERIRCGDTYQTNLTQQLTVELPDETTPQLIFWNLRRSHPAPFAAFITRGDSTVVSASPERFFRVEGSRITTSPIKGTRPRGKDATEDEALKRDLLTSEKDIAENTMIVDLLRNDLGRVCEFGSVRVEKLCDLEEHPTLLHLVSTISGELRPGTAFSDILRAVFPCGSITGAPKISTMRIIDEIETTSRGLSMGAIGLYVPSSGFSVQSSESRASDAEHRTLNSELALSVAIRTMVVRDSKAVFNVGGGIVIDSDPKSEYEESLLKAKALLDAMSAGFHDTMP
jgi:para-aminobenzoate synthetase component 1